MNLRAKVRALVIDIEAGDPYTEAIRDVLNLLEPEPPPVGSGLERLLYDHREDALTCYDHDGYCCVCGRHNLQVTWRQHLAKELERRMYAPHQE